MGTLVGFSLEGCALGLDDGKVDVGFCVGAVVSGLSDGNFEGISLVGF